MISRDDVRKLAVLARIKLSEGEEDKLAKDMRSILGYVEQIQKVSGDADTRGREVLKNVMREDAHPHESGLHTEALLTEAPRREDNYVKVKKIL
jgi:aspartyl-tRNA(Asn)/glutamyl-tRNA(Gln) amidotransferase subunit C